MFTIDTRSRVPIYEQLTEKIKELIIREVMKADEQLPSVRTLAQELTINPNTIQKAYRELEREGFIYSIPGKGSFVSPVKNEINKERVEMLKHELERIVGEILYLGVPKDEVIKLIETMQEPERGADKND
ncbi:GntR family transcriptional regulator [Domibacillus sp. DTU_2020_1001157_1_SI_ALB_TIR_016]|uniref:GntR family transcriptional regulator n=1 Tax=Domibacillus sp. DTU_2020_1001157_1_SI_ALB_TIR_016 TaxID=3077789 RepID=UPI0028E300A6|nr:GntR family transcriptional regulator [Domibacillus sp. DTU_2020_1001157_1_SI_ALB_TIR_016]WNS81241.1 GntR family transcriptional regulator [Domibacillus sp. DTU_2020_1001157_1_SI_ALB_TIR_016]